MIEDIAKSMTRLSRRDGVGEIRLVLKRGGSFAAYAMPNKEKARETAMAYLRDTGHESVPLALLQAEVDKHRERAIGVGSSATPAGALDALWRVMTA
jgi:hypothetical protein